MAPALRRNRFTATGCEPNVHIRVRIASWNLWWRYGRWWERREAIVAELRHVRPYVCGLQEVWSDPDQNLADESSCTVEVMGS